jgi:nucleoside-diphosphate-sugar epimerase
MDVSKLKKAGWHSTTFLEEGIALTYQWLLDNQTTLKEVKL